MSSKHQDNDKLLKAKFTGHHFTILKKSITPPSGSSLCQRQITKFKKTCFSTPLFFQGVGVSLMLVQGMSGVYSIVITSWMFVYFRDSFITIHQPYKWSRCEKDVPAFENLRQCHHQNANQNWSLQQVIENVLLLESSCPSIR